MRKTLYLTSALVLIGMSLTYANPMEARLRDGSGMPYGYIEKLEKKLNLTQEQVHKIATINATYKAKYSLYKIKLLDSRKKIIDLSKSSHPDYTTIEAILTQQSPILVSMGLDRIHHRKEIEAVLTSAQQSKLQNLFLKKWKTHSHE